jgi:hypothetical protein
MGGAVKLPVASMTTSATSWAFKARFSRLIPSGLLANANLKPAGWM